MIVICDKCKCEFKIKLKVRKMRTFKDVEMHYFKCPKCKTEYFVAYKNKMIKELEQRLATINSYIEHNPNCDIEQKQRERMQLTFRLKQEYKSLESKIKGV